MNGRFSVIPGKDVMIVLSNQASFKQIVSHRFLLKEFLCCLSWPPCVADADIILSSCGVFFFFLLSRLISAVAEWMSTILLHMVWP